MKRFLPFLLAFLTISCNNKIKKNYFKTAECYMEFEVFNKKYNNELVVYDVCVVSKGMLWSMKLDSNLTTTKDSILIQKTAKEISKYFYSIPSHDEKYPNRCGKIRMRFTRTVSK
jgi:hypothetical protein